LGLLSDRRRECDHFNYSVFPFARPLVAESEAIAKS
jgi:hypothetical protein